VSRALRLTLLLVVSAAALAAILHYVGFQTTAQAVRQAGLAAFAIVGLDLAALLALQAASLAALSRPIEHRVPSPTLFNAVTVGMGANVLAPSAYLAGEPVKVVYIARKAGLPYAEVTGTIVLAKYLTALSFVLFFGVSTVVAAASYRDLLFRPPYLAGGITLVVLATALLALCVILWLALSRRWCPLTRLVGLLAWVRPSSGFLARLRDRTREMEQQVARVFHEERRAARGAFALIALSHVVIFVKPGLFFLLGWGIGLSLGELSLLYVAGQALLAFQATPSGAGTLEAVLLGTFALLNAGVAHAQVMAYALCLHFWDGAVLAAGALLASRVGIGILSRRPAQTSEPEDAG
jgi:uncharacterized protein (TIRG00374 family)